MGRTAEAWQSPPEITGEDYISNAIYTDPDLFKEELERLAVVGARLRYLAGIGSHDALAGFSDAA